MNGQMDFPNLRAGLVVSQQDSGANPSVVIKIPETRWYFRLGAIEYEIVQQLDGQTSPEVVRNYIQERHGAELDEETLDRFLTRLEQAGLLESSEDVPVATTDTSVAWARRILSQARRSPLFIRLKAFDPDWLLNYLSRHTELFFTRTFLVVSALTIVAGLGLFFTHTGQFFLEARALFKWGTLLLLWPSLFLIITLHEFAHGLTCKRFGGEVREMGFLLLYFQPCFYCDVSDAWLFPQKSRRLWVTLAGAYFELFAWAVTVVFWRLSAPGSLLHEFSLIVVLTSGIKALFNLNPLIKLDGYYLLSDWLDVPNLRQRAFAFLRGGRAAWAATTPRLRRVYSVYGLLAGAYTLFLFGYITLSVAGYLTARYQAWGAVMMAGLVFGLGGQSFKSLGGRMRNIFTNVRDILKAGGPRRRRLVLGGAGALVLAIVPWPLKISAEFQVIPLHNADIHAETSGLVEAVYVREGQEVKKGQVLARLRDSELRAEIGKLEKLVAEKNARLRLLEAGPRRERIELMRSRVAIARTKLELSRQQLDEAERLQAQRLQKASATVEKSQSHLEFGRQELARAKALHDQGLISRAKYEEAVAQQRMREKEQEETDADLALVQAETLTAHHRELAVARGEYEEAQGQLMELLAGARPEEMEAAAAELAKYEVELEYLRQELTRTEILSPKDGIVVTPKLEGKVGQFIERGELLCEVYDFHRVRIEMAVPEKELADVSPGQAVVLKARGFPGETFRGQVSRIAPTVNKKYNFCL